MDVGIAALWITAPSIAVGLELSSTQVGLIFTVVAIAGGITHIPASLLGETRFRGAFLLSTFWWVAGAYLAASLAPSYWVLLVFIALAASGAAAWHPVAMGTLAEHLPSRRAFALGGALCWRVIDGGSSTDYRRAPSRFHELAQRYANYSCASAGHGGALPATAPMDPTASNWFHVTERHKDPGPG